MIPDTAMAVARCVFPVPGPPMNTTFCVVSVNDSVASCPTRCRSAVEELKSNPARSRCTPERVKAFFQDPNVRYAA